MSAPLSIAIGRTPRTEALFGRAGLDLAEVPVISRAFAPMVREGRYEVSEMAIATFLMAKAAGRPLVLLPAILAARFQESALLCRAASGFRTPLDLRGRRIGVRAYSQTTGMWLRGILREDFQFDAEEMRWVTFEDAHMKTYRDPPWAERAPPGSEMLAMLRAGALDAAIFGADTPQDDSLRSVFPDPAAAGEAFFARHGFVPVNHLLVARRDVADARTAELRDLLHLLREAGCDVPGRDALAAPLSLAIRYASEQGLLSRPLSLDDVWDGTPAALAS